MAAAIPHDVPGAVSDHSLMPEGLEGRRLCEPSVGEFEEELARRKRAADRIRSRPEGGS